MKWSGHPLGARFGLWDNRPIGSVRLRAYVLLRILKRPREQSLHDIMARLEAAIGPRYRVDRLIARGGMACVFEGFDTDLKRHVALKVLESAPATRKRYSGPSARAGSRPNWFIQHRPGLRQTQVSRIPRAGHGVRERQSLKEVLKERGRLSVGETRRLGLQMLDALKCAHDAGVIHRDVKPGNILMGRKEALLADFGISSTVDWGDETLTDPEQSPPATPAYMSPEQKLGPVDHRSDLFSLGVTLRQCLLGLRTSRYETSDKMPGAGFHRTFGRSSSAPSRSTWRSGGRAPPSSRRHLEDIGTS